MRAITRSVPQSDVVLPAGTPKARACCTDAGRRFDGKPLKPDSADEVKFGDVSLTIIERGDKVGARLRDPDAATGENFTGCTWFPISESWP